MKKFLKVFTALVLVAVVAACGKPEPTAKAQPPAFNPAIDLKVTAWGPQDGKAGDVPNKQPDGSMGVWIKVNTLEGLGAAQVLFAGQAASTTVVEAKENLITAAVPAALLSAAGDKEVAVKQLGSQKVFSVGVFKTVN